MDSPGPAARRCLLRQRDGPGRSGPRCRPGRTSVGVSYRRRQLCRPHSISLDRRWGLVADTPRLSPHRVTRLGWHADERLRRRQGDARRSHRVELDAARSDGTDAAARLYVDGGYGHRGAHARRRNALPPDGRPLQRRGRDAHRASAGAHQRRFTARSLDSCRRHPGDRS